MRTNPARSSSEVSTERDSLLDLIAVGMDHLRRFFAEQARENGRPARFEIRLVDIELVGVDCPLDDGLTETVASGDENDVLETGFCVEREGDPRSTRGRSAPMRCTPAEIPTSRCSNP